MKQVETMQQASQQVVHGVTQCRDLPLELIIKITGLLVEKFKSRALGDNSFNAPGLQYEAEGVLAFFQPLRSISKGLLAFCDSLRTSIHFQACDQNLVDPYVRKLANLNAVTIIYSPNAFDVHASLTSLLAVCPALNTLILEYQTILDVAGNPSPSYGGTFPGSSSSGTGDNPFTFPCPPRKFINRMEGHMGSLLLPWKNTLQQLVLTNFSCLTNAEKGGLHFLSQLQHLKVLSLSVVLPIIQNQDIAGCVGLCELTMSGNLNERLVDDITNLNLSIFTSLTAVNVFRYRLVSINVTGLTKLTKLILGPGNFLDKLDVSTRTALQHLKCDDNSIRELDVSACLELRTLHCSTQDLTKLNVHGGSLLTELICNSCRLTELDLSTCTALAKLQCQQSQLSTLNVHGCSLLTELICDGCPLRELDLSTCTALETLQCRQSKLRSLDMRKCPILKSLDAKDSKLLSVVHVAGLTRLHELHLQNSSITSLDLNGCSALRVVDCFSSKELFELNMAGCSALEVLNITSCPLKSLSLTDCVRLSQLDCDRTDLVSLDVSPAAATLTSLSCDNSPLELLCLTGCSRLETISCKGCPLVEVRHEGCDSLKDVCYEDSALFGM